MQGTKDEGSLKPTKRKARYDRHDRAVHHSAHSLTMIIDRLMTPILSKTTEMQSRVPINSEQVTHGEKCVSTSNDAS